MVNSKINIIAITISSLICTPVIAARYNTQDKNNLSKTPSIFKDLTLQRQANPFSQTNQHSESKQKQEDYTKILKLISKQNFSEAKNELRKLKADKPEYFNLQALLAIQEKDTPRAILSYKKALALDAKNLMSNMGLATYSFETKDLKTAKKYADISLGINNQLASAYLLLADIARSQNKIKESENILLNALNTVKGNFKPEIKIASSLTKFYAFQRLPKKILNLSRNLQNQYPNNPKVLSIVARAQIVNDQKKLAEQTLSQLINLDKQDAEHRILLANLLKTQTEKETQVLQLLDEASNLEKNNPRALVYKTTYLIQLKRLTQALIIANKIDALFPQLALGKMLTGDIYLLEKKFDQALEINLKAYQIQANKKLFSTIISILVKQGKNTKAIDFAKQELSKNPNNSAIHFTLASLFQNNNNLSQAIQHYESILSQTPKHSQALNNLAWIYSQQNNPKSLEMAKQAYTINPQSASILDTYGFILVQQGQSKEAITILKKAIQLEPKQYDIQFHLAQAYLANGNNKQAIITIKPLLQADKVFSEKQSAIRLFDQLNKK